MERLTRVKGGWIGPGFPRGGLGAKPLWVLPVVNPACEPRSPRSRPNLVAQPPCEPVEAADVQRAEMFPQMVFR